MEKINLKSGTRYREMVRINGEIIKSPRFPRKADAKTWKMDMESKKLRGELAHEYCAEKSKMKFKDFAKYWLEEIIYPDTTERTHRNYESKLRVHINPFFGNKYLRDITESHCRLFMVYLKKTNHNGKGANCIAMVVRSILLRARREKYISTSPFENVPKNREELTCDRYWTKKEIEQFLLTNHNHYLNKFFFVTLHTGMRLAEVCGLQWDRVDFALNQITVTRVRDKLSLRDTTKTQIKRIIPMTPSVKSVLWGILKEQLDPRFVFCKTKGEPVPYGHVYRDFKKCQRKAGFENTIRFHDLRHTFASQFMMNGGSLFDLQKILGHTDMKMTMRYAHFSPEHLQSALPYMEMSSSEPVLNLFFKNGEDSENLLTLSN